MINTLSDLLKAFSETENQRLKELDITHPPTIGAMYEGLTADILQKSIFEGLNLVVAKSSFIKGCQTEFDVILAEGEGVPVPYTDKYEFSPEQVLVVIQVKKTLYSNELSDSYENLMHISDLYLDLPPDDYVCRLATDSIHNTLQKSVTDIDEKKLTLQEEYVYHSLATEAQLPLRIVLGYNGLKSEYSLREKFYAFLGDKVSGEGDIKRGYGPTNFPSLFICENSSIVKMMGTPYNAPLKQSAENWWDFLASTHYNPMYLFLDCIWTKLTYKFGMLPNILGDDLETPKMTPFLSCQIAKQGDLIGWNYWYHSFTKDDLKTVYGTFEWQPYFLDEIQFRVMNLLCANGKLSKDDIPLVETDALNAGYESLEALYDSLCKTGMVAKVDDNNISLISRGCQVMMIGDRFLMGENNSGRFDNWLMKHAEEFFPWNQNRDD